MSYRNAIEAAGANVLAFEYFGSYQGEWWAKVESNGKTGWITGSFGSCSYCDAYQRWESDTAGWDREPTTEELKSFGSTYIETMLSQEEAEKEASRNIEWDSEAEEMVAFIKGNA